MNRDHVLIIEDDLTQQHMLSKLLSRRLGLTVLCAENGREGLQILQNHSDVMMRLVILDLNLPIMHGLEVLDILRQRYPDIPVIVLSSTTDNNNVTEALSGGALDFIAKPYEADRLITTVKNALKLSILSKEVSRLHDVEEGHFKFSQLIGHDGGLFPFVQMGRKAAQTSIPVLITGETGVGKEVFAQAIHGESERKGKPFITVNCGAIPSQLVESILFGHEKGAFTGATEKTIGKFREAEGGTIFLDEIGELPLDAQVKLLRVLQQKEVEPVGATKPVPIDVRIISATNRDLDLESKQGDFREDLFFRLNVFEICLPPLSQRREDIPLLARHFISRFCARENVIHCTLSDEADDYLKQCKWPGNVRDLENAISRAMVMDEDGVLDLSDFSRNVTEKSITFSASSSDAMLQHYSIFTEDEHIKPLAQIEQDIMTIALQHYDQNMTKTAQMLGIAKSTFYRKMKDIK